MEQQEKTFKYKLDFYYQSALIYLVTLILYGGIRGSFVEKKFEYVLNDPLMYVIMLFVVIALTALLLNYIRNRRLIISGDTMIFKNRWRERRVDASQMEWIHIGREAGVQTSGRFQAIMFKVKGRRRVVRIRIGRYEREKELVNEIERIATHTPKRKRRQWQRPRVTDR